MEALIKSQTSLAPPTTEIRPRTPQPRHDNANSTKAKIQVTKVCTRCYPPWLPFWTPPFTPAERVINETYTLYNRCNAANSHISRGLRFTNCVGSGSLVFTFYLGDMFLTKRYKTRAFIKFDHCFDLLRRFISLGPLQELLPWLIYNFLIFCNQTATHHIADRLLGFVSELLAIRKALHDTCKVSCSPVPILISQLEQVPVEERQEVGLRGLNIIEDILECDTRIGTYELPVEKISAVIISVGGSGGAAAVSVSAHRARVKKAISALVNQLI